MVESTKEKTTTKKTTKPATDNTGNDKLLEQTLKALQKQLTVKDKQIDGLQRCLEQQQILLQQANEKIKLLEKVKASNKYDESFNVYSTDSKVVDSSEKKREIKDVSLNSDKNDELIEDTFEEISEEMESRDETQVGKIVEVIEELSNDELLEHRKAEAKQRGLDFMSLYQLGIEREKLPKEEDYLVDQWDDKLFDELLMPWLKQVIDEYIKLKKEYVDATRFNILKKSSSTKEYELKQNVKNASKKVDKFFISDTYFNLPDDKKMKMDKDIQRFRKWHKK